MVPPLREIVILPPVKATAIKVDPSALMAAFIQSPCESAPLAPFGPLDAIHVEPVSTEV